MAESDIKLVQAWLLKAAHDLQAAQNLSSGERDPLDAAIYHCQQAAEKAVKAYLCHAGVAMEKTHDVERLIKLAAKHLPDFSLQLDDAEIVTPYATRFRYPMEGVPAEPPQDEFDEALAAARRIYDFVLSVLPVETHPV
jgi:HEPN domain-containing protein